MPYDGIRKKENRYSYTPILVMLLIIILSIILIVGVNNYKAEVEPLNEAQTQLLRLERVTADTERALAILEKEKAEHKQALDVYMELLNAYAIVKLDVNYKLDTITGLE